MERAQCSDGTRPAETTATHPTNGDKDFYQVRRDKMIKGLLKTYCESKNADYNSVAFLHYSQRIRDTKTPDEIGMEDEDEIDAMFHQTGGGY
ncbi:hypothetical protein DH2020_022860 [Rehmannia glutinosa]|uniref:Rad60/SUMO-like domain-containing protein n=1 Tax=Rehmannia glutinosa TaxID=99300 RepID=A0ABR0W8E1_REHGL